MTKDIKQIQEEINLKLDQNPLLIPAVALTNYLIRNYSEQDWEEYEKETKNNRVSVLPPKNGLEAMIDEATGFKDSQDFNLANFLLWNINEFERGLNE